MELRHLSGFVAVAEELHFGRAARRLYMSQPALTRLVRQLEEELGVALLVRSTRQVALTTSGRTFLAESREVLARVDAAARAARQWTSAHCLHVGFCPLTEEALADGLRRFRSQRPDVAVVLREVGPTLSPTHLEDEALDLVLTHALVEGPGLLCQEVRSDPLLLAVPESHPLARRASVTLDDVADGPPLHFPRSQLPEACAALVATCAAAGVRLVTEDVPSFRSAVIMVAAEVGLSLVPASGSVQLQLPGVALRPVSGDPLTLPLLISRRSQERRGPVRELVGVLASASAGPATSGSGPTLAFRN